MAEKMVTAEELRNAPGDLQSAVVGGLAAKAQLEGLKTFATAAAAAEVSGEPAPATEAKAMTERQALVFIEGALGDFLDQLLEQTKQDLVELQGLDRQNAEALIKAGQPVLKGIRHAVQALQKEPSRIIRPRLAAVPKP
jgi:hypothetical protein